MAESGSHSLARYLEAKQTVDDRALNRRVWSDFLDRLWERHSADKRLAILDVAGGIGSTAHRILRALPDDLSGEIEYTLVDVDPDLIRGARMKLPEWGHKCGFSAQATATTVTVEQPELDITIYLVCEDAFDYLLEEAPQSYDCVITQAWLDLVHLDTALKRIFRVLCEDGLFYGPIHFDGETQFVPTVDDDLDECVVEIYHRSLDERETEYGSAGGSRTGSRLLDQIPTVGGRTCSVGSSDWIVRPNGNGDYPNDEAYFLKHILRFVESEIIEADELAHERAKKWLETRRAQVESGTLQYIAHHLDILAKNTGRVAE